jgi:WD40 repeat protein/serine/threonine protein kinase/tetratricopeptide (TPR) repeat protein
MSAQLADARQIFLEAVEKHAPEQWPELLDSVCQADAELRARVEALLEAHGQYNSMLDGEGFVATVDVRVSERPGAQIGPYKLLQQIGEGGFGVVFMAEQTAPVRRKVALKVIKPGMDTRQVIARFEAERQALAVMDHPNIARVYDAGTTESGRPYFVMELVAGVPITAYCDQNNLPIRERLSLFATVCQAIQHAHTKGIIHRDIKPSNVLITKQDGQPVVKVIDFGIAKAMGQQLTDKTLFTEFAQIVGTPLYMSPEQAELSSTDIDTRSDIYSLGVLLYELLTGTTPVDKEQLKKAALDEIRRIIREEDPPKPSTRISTAEAAPSIAAQRQTEPARLSKLVRGELDWIVMKCLEKDRNRRYETANGLARDIEHYLHDEPVVACPPSAAYRFRKFIRRNKAVLAMTGAVVAALLLAVVGLAISNVLVRTERNEKITALGQKEKALGEKQAALGAKDAALKVAKRNYAEAKRQEGLAQKQEKLAKRRFYAAQMNLAMQAWEDGQPARTLHLLESLRPRFDEDDLRGFDWYYLWRLCQGSYRFAVPTLGFDNASAIAMSPDGAMLAAGYGNAVRLWDASTGRQIGELTGHANMISGLAFSPDGKTLASADESETVKLWDPATNTLRAAVQAGQGVACVQFIGDGHKLLLSGKRVKLWDLVADKEVAALGEPGDSFGFVGAAFNGSVVAASSKNAVHIWTQDGSDWRSAPPLTGIGEFPRLAISQDGKLLAVADGTHSKGSIKVYDLPSRQERIAIQGHNGLYAIKFTSDGKRLTTGARDRTVRMWDVATGRQEACIAQPGPVYGLALSPDGGTVAAKGADAIRVWDVAPPAPASVLPHLTPIDTVAFSPDGKIVAARGTSETILWNLTEERVVATLSTAGPTRWLRGLAFSPDGQSLAIPRGSGIDVWSVSGERMAVLPCQAPVHQAAWSPDGKSLAAATMNDHSGFVEVWDVPSKQRRYSTPMSNDVAAVAFSPDGKMIAAGYQFGVVKLFEAASGRELSTLQRFELAIEWANCLAFSPDSRKLATGNRLGMARIWDVATNQLDATMVGHTSSVTSLAFLDGGRTLVTGSDDRTVRLWEVETGQERITLQGHTGGVTGVAFSAKGNVLATSSRDGTVRLWRAAVDDRARAPQSELDSKRGQSPVADNEAGDLLWQAGRVDEAEAAYRRALERLEKLRASSAHEIAHQQETIRSLLSISLLLRIERGDQEGAEAARLRAMESYRKLAPQEQRALFLIFCERQRKLNGSGARQQAERTFSQAIELIPQDDAGWFTRAAQHLASCSDVRLRNMTRAVEFAQKAVALPVKDRTEHAGALAYLGGLLGGVGRRSEAEEPYRKATALYQELSDEEPENEWYRHERAYFSLALANLLVAASRYEDALAPCRVSVELGEQLVIDFPSGPDHAERLGHARNVLISILSSLGRDDEAAEIARQQEQFAKSQAAPREANLSNEPPPQAPKDRGWALLHQEKFVEAETAFRAAIQLDPTDAAAHRGLGGSLQKQHKIAEAMSSLREAIRLDPAEFWAHDNLGWLFLGEGQPAEAEVEFREAVRIQPALASSFFGLGAALRDQKKFAESAAPLREAIRLNPDDQYARDALGWSLIESGQFAEAEAENLIKAPDLAAKYYEQAQLLHQQKKSVEAEAALRQAIRLEPANYSWREFLGRVLLESKQFAEAEAEFREAIRLNAAAAAGHYLLGSALREQGKHAEAVASLREAIRLDPSMHYAHDNLGWMYINSGEFSQAEAEFREEIRLKPDLAAAHFGLARALVEQEKFAEAEIAAREILRLEPEHRWAPNLLNRALKGQGKPPDKKAAGPAETGPGAA